MDTKTKFPLGRIVATPGVLDAIAKEDMGAALQRHSQGDWGELDKYDALSNDHSLETGGRLLSAYCSSQDVKFWIITEADRSTTTLLLPSEY